MLGGFEAKPAGLEARLYVSQDGRRYNSQTVLKLSIETGFEKKGPMKNAQNLRDTSWRRPLTEAEKAELRASLPAEDQERAELDFALTQALSRLPDVPVSNNFTARVRAAAESERRAAEREARGSRFWRVLFPRIAFAASGVTTLVVIFSLISHHQDANARQMVESLSAVSGVESLPPPEVLQDFEAIRQLNTAPAPDEQLLALFP